MWGISSFFDSGILFLLIFFIIVLMIILIVAYILYNKFWGGDAMYEKNRRKEKQNKMDYYPNYEKADKFKPPITKSSSNLPDAWIREQKIDIRQPQDNIRELYQDIINFKKDIMDELRNINEKIDSKAANVGMVSPPIGLQDNPIINEMRKTLIGEVSKINNLLVTFLKANIKQIEADVKQKAEMQREFQGIILGNDLSHTDANILSGEPIKIGKKTFNVQNLISWWNENGAIISYQACERSLNDNFEGIEVKLIKHEPGNTDLWYLIGVKKKNMAGSYSVLPRKSSTYTDYLKEWFDATTQNFNRTARIISLIKAAEMNNIQTIKGLVEVEAAG